MLPADDQCRIVVKIKKKKKVYKSGADYVAH